MDWPENMGRSHLHFGTSIPRVHMYSPIAPNPHVTEDGLDRHQWRRGHWSYQVSMHQCRVILGCGGRRENGKKHKVLERIQHTSSSLQSQFMRRSGDRRMSEFYWTAWLDWQIPVLEE